ncbi:MAG TPA: hypothetical protein VFT46_00455 [Holophagaceae bacterium]|nr:hypothetical protein [Holophagaceae bacterium]
MRRLLLASFALLLTFLPFQAGGAPVAAKACCAGCAGMPSCPPRCPAPPSQPGPCLSPVAPATEARTAIEAEAARPVEPSPLPADLPHGQAGPKGAQILAALPREAGPPDPGARQALLRVFRI